VIASIENNAIASYFVGDSFYNCSIFGKFRDVIWQSDRTR
jgi:hypothetical protein